jgi:hypothetical protein
MAIKDKKKEVLAKVNSLDKITEKNSGLFNNTKSKLDKKKDAAKEGINNKKNKVMEFITKLALIVITFEAIKKAFIDTISSRLPIIEKEIKTELKKQLKEIISCNINPSMPDWLKNEGISIKVKDIDFFDILKIDPTSVGGKLIYNDGSFKLTSTDLNTFLYNVITNNKDVKTLNGGTYYPWGSSTVGMDFLDVKFSPLGTIDGKNEINVLNFKPNANASTMTLTQFNEKFVDSIKIFGDVGSDKVINKLMDNLFGSIKNSVKTPEAKLVEEEKFNKSVECIIHAENEIDDSFFTFSNEELNEIERDLKKKRKGVRVLDCCQKNNLTLDTNVLLNAQEDIKKSFDNPPPTLTKETSKREAVQKNLDAISDNATRLVIDPIDIKNVKINFILELFKQLPVTLISFLISPKLIAIYTVNHQLIYGKDTSYSDPIDFIKKNKNMFKAVCKTVAIIVIKVILVLIIKKLVQKLTTKLIDDNIEHNKTIRKQLKTLMGIGGKINPIEILNKLKM